MPPVFGKEMDNEFHMANTSNIGIGLFSFNFKIAECRMRIGKLRFNQIRNPQSEIGNSKPCCLTLSDEK